MAGKMANRRVVRVFRYDPSSGSKGHFDRFELDIEDENLTTILDVLLRIQREHDPSLAFRYSCRISMCGSCGMVVNGKEAVKALEAIPYDIVLMDIQMPEMDGIEATRVIRDPSSGVKRHDVSIIAMTANAMKGDKEKYLAAGMDSYISKPITPDALRDVVEEQLSSQKKG